MLSLPRSCRVMCRTEVFADRAAVPGSVTGDPGRKIRTLQLNVFAGESCRSAAARRASAGSRHNAEPDLRLPSGYAGPVATHRFQAVSRAFGRANFTAFCGGGLVPPLFLVDRLMSLKDDVGKMASAALWSANDLNSCDEPSSAAKACLVIPLRRCTAAAWT